MRTRNIIPDFTKPEIDYIKENANFTEEERLLFEMRNEEKTMQYCADVIGVSLSTLSNRINPRMLNKIGKVIRHMYI